MIGRAVDQPWWINAHERPPEFDALCRAFFAAGLCDWAGSQHPQEYALVALHALGITASDGEQENHQHG